MPTFEFQMRLTERDTSGYYYLNWENAQRVTVLGETKAEAIEKAKTMLGKPVRHDAWACVVDKITEIPTENSLQ